MSNHSYSSRSGSSSKALVNAQWEALVGRQCSTFSRLIPVMLLLYDEMKENENNSQ